MSTVKKEQPTYFMNIYTKEVADYEMWIQMGEKQIQAEIRGERLVEVRRTKTRDERAEHGNWVEVDIEPRGFLQDFDRFLEENDSQYARHNEEYNNERDL